MGGAEEAGAPQWTSTGAEEAAGHWTFARVDAMRLRLLPAEVASSGVEEAQSRQRRLAPVEAPMLPAEQPAEQSCRAEGVGAGPAAPPVVAAAAAAPPS